MTERPASGPAQLALDFAPRPALGRADFLVSPANAEALALVSEPLRWPGGRLALTGPESAGKTHLAHVWMHETGALAREGSALSAGEVPALAAHGRVAVEDVDRIASLAPDRRKAAEDALFHLWNLMGSEGGRLLLTGRAPPARWEIATPDLASRLQSLTVARIAPPDDALLALVLAKHFADRQIPVPEEVVRFLAARIERSFAAAERVARALDRASLAEGRPVTRPFAARLLDRLASEHGA